MQKSLFGTFAATLATTQISCAAPLNSQSTSPKMNTSSAVAKTSRGAARSEAPGRAPYLVLAHYMPSTRPLAFNPNDTYWYNTPYHIDRDNLLTRPTLTPRPDAPNVLYQGYVDDIRLAKSYGIDGFFVDYLEDEDAYRTAWTYLLKAAEQEGDFKIGMMPDAATLGGDYVKDGNQKYGTKREKIKRWLDIADDSPALLRYDDKPVVMEYGNGYPDANGTAQQVKTQFLDWMDAQGKPVSYGAVLGADWPLYEKPFAKDPKTGYPSIAFGMGTFTPGMTETKFFERHLNYFGPDTMQMGENRIMYYNSKWFYSGDRLTTTYRKFWQFLIANRSRIRWTQLLTWNDLGESAMQPTVHHGMAWQPLTKYYAQWFKTGVEPKIEKDWLAVFHRQHPYAAKPTINPKRVTGNVTIPTDEVEALAFLTKPATLILRTGSKETRKAVGAGVQSLIVPFQLGVQSARLVRDGKIILRVSTPIPVHDKPVRENLWFVAADSAHPPRALDCSWKSDGSCALRGGDFTLGNSSSEATFAPSSTKKGVVARLFKGGHYEFTATQKGDGVAWQIVRAGDTSSTRTLDSGTFKPKNKVVRLRLDAVGEHIVGYIDGTLVSSNVYDFEYSHGRAGVVGNIQDYSNVRVFSLDPPLIGGISKVSPR